MVARRQQLERREGARRGESSPVMGRAGRPERVAVRVRALSRSICAGDHVMDMLVRTASNEAHGSEHCLLLCITRTVSLAVVLGRVYCARRREREPVGV